MDKRTAGHRVFRRCSSVFWSKTASWFLSGTALFLLTAGMTLTAHAGQCSLVSYSAADWVSQPATFGRTTSYATVAAADSVLCFNNTKGLWPEITCMVEPPLKFSVADDRIRYDFTPGKRTAIRVLFRDSQGENQTVVINPAVSGATFYSTTGEINSSSKALTGTLSLLGLHTGNYSNGRYTGPAVETLADARGEITLLGITIPVVGDAAGTVQLRELSAVIADSPAVSSTATTKTTASTSRRSSMGTGGNSSSSARSDSSGSSAGTSDTTGQTQQAGASSGSDGSGSGQGGHASSSGGAHQPSIPGILPSDSQNGGREGDSPFPAESAGQPAIVTHRSASGNLAISGKAVTLLMIAAGGGILFVAWRCFSRTPPSKK